jgi:hypothetical protein
MARFNSYKRWYGRYTDLRDTQNIEAVIYYNMKYKHKIFQSMKYKHKIFQNMKYKHKIFQSMKFRPMTPSEMKSKKFINISYGTVMYKIRKYKQANCKGNVKW